MGTTHDVIKNPSFSERTQQLFREAKWIVLALLGLALLSMLVSFDPNDPSFFHAGSDVKEIHNWVGSLGAWVSATLLYVFGLSAYWWVLLCGWVIYRGVRRFLRLSLYSPQERAALAQTTQEKRDTLLFRVGFVVVLLTSMGLEYLHTSGWKIILPYDHGGVLGAMIAKGLGTVLGPFLPRCCWRCCFVPA